MFVTLARFVAHLLAALPLPAVVLVAVPARVVLHTVQAVRVLVVLVHIQIEYVELTALHLLVVIQLVVFLMFAALVV